VEFRPLRAEELRDAVYAGQIGFGQSTADENIDRSIARRFGPDFALAAFEDGTLVAQVATLPFRAYWNGPTIGCGGVTSVNTLPSHRRRGYVRELLIRSLAQMRDAGQPISLLWATMSAIYQRFGYGIAFAEYDCSFDARRLTFVDAIEPSGRIRMVKLEESLPLLEPVYDRFAALRTPAIRRDEFGWERRRRDIVAYPERGRPPLLAAIYEEAGEILGYVVYDVTSGAGWHEPEERLSVLELVWLTLSAHRALIQFLAAYDLAVSVRWQNLEADNPLLHHVQEPRELHTTVSDGALLRIVDVQPALEGRGYNADGRLTFSIEDGLCPWNDGAWELDVEHGVARVRRSTAEPALQLTPRALAMLATGYQTATTLARLGLLTSPDPRALGIADRLFQTACAPYCMDRF
jgi:predicted acetyltransferase